MKLSMTLWFLNLAHLALTAAIPGSKNNEITSHSNLSFAVRRKVAEADPTTLQKYFFKNFTQTAAPGKSQCASGNQKSLTAANSPIINDCQLFRGLMHQAFGFYTGWNWDTNRQVIFNYGSCYFYLVRTDGKTGPVTIGNLDIESHLNDAITKFGSNGHVGAIGDTVCSDPDQQEVAVEWSIFSSSTS